MMPRLLYIRKGINSCKLGVKGNIFSLFLLYDREDSVKSFMEN